MIGAEVLVRMLLEYNVDTLFGVPGDTSLPLYEALYDARSKIRHVMARDERSASFMADAYARISHKPGVCECPSGAGPLYSLPGVAEANASSIPVILITSDVPLAAEGKKVITELDCQRLFQSVTKWSGTVKEVEKLPETLRRAFRIATTGRPGAVHLALPQEALTRKYQGDDRNIYAEGDCSIYPAYRLRGSKVLMEELAKLLISCERPVIIAGGGANHSQAGEEIARLAKWLAAPVVTTISGQGIMPDEHQLALGVVGDNGFHPHAHQAVEEGDFLLYVGCKMGSVSTLNWTLPSFKPDRKIVQIDLDPEVLSNNSRNTLSVVGDVKLVLQDLVVMLEGKTKPRKLSRWVKDLNVSRNKFWRNAVEHFRSDANPIKPHRLVSALNKQLTVPSIVIADAGTPTPYITRFLKLSGKGSRFIIPRSYGGLGYSIPALVGAHFASPHLRLVAVFGDGSLGMSAGDLETIGRLGIKAVLINFNNGSFGWVKALQALHSNRKLFSVDFNAGDPVRVAEGFGLKAIRIETANSLEDKLDEAFAEESPVFLDVMAESEIDDIPPVLSWVKAAERQNVLKGHE